MSQIIVSKDRLYMFLVSSVRYALGRSSYIVGLTADAVRDYWRYLDPGMREVILRDIKEALDGRLRLGMEMDHNTWLALHRELDPESKCDG